MHLHHSNAEHVPADAGYDRWAAVYDTDNNPMLALNDRAIQEEFAVPLGGKRVLDLGCGTGRYTLQLAAEGAIVTGVDLSNGMLDVARGKPGAERATFIQHDLGQPLPLADEAFDAAISSLVLEHIADLDVFFREARRVCKPGAPLFFTAMHPAMFLKDTQAGFHDPETGHKVRPHSYPHGIADFVNAMIAAGLQLRHLREYLADEELARQWPRAEKHVGWPILVSFRVVR